jgi:hypothetical protein
MYIYICECSTVVALPSLLVVADVTNWYQSSKGKVKSVWVPLLGMLVVEDVTVGKWNSTWV